MERYVYKFDDISDVKKGPAAFAACLNIEQGAIRKILNNYSPPGARHHAADIGCGYGRLTPVLKEFYSNVTGFEREPHFVEAAMACYEGIDFRIVKMLGKIPVNDGHFDFVMTFTVLQHLQSFEIGAAVDEIRRIVTPGGYALLSEETDGPPTTTSDNPGLQTCTPRPVEEYRELMQGFSLILDEPRPASPASDRKQCGRMMLFRRG